MSSRESGNRSRKSRKRPWQHPERHAPLENFGFTVEKTGRRHEQPICPAYDENPNKLRRIDDDESKKKKPKRRARPKKASKRKTPRIVPLEDDSDSLSDMPVSAPVDDQGLKAQEDLMGLQEFLTQNDSMGQQDSTDQPDMPHEDLMALQQFLAQPGPIGQQDLIAHQNPITAMTEFVGLPTEVRDEILRYILLWPHEIVVFNGWSCVYPRSRPHLDLSILYTCKVLRCQGLRILFGENTFMYELRDPEESHKTHKMMERVFGGCLVPINEYGHLIRRIKIKVDRSRFLSDSHRHNFENSILKFLPGEGLACLANLHTLTIEIPAECEGDLRRPGRVDKPEEIAICQYLKKGSKFNNALRKLHIKRVRVLAWDRNLVCWEAVFSMHYYVKDEQMRLEYEALNEDDEPDINNSAIDQDTTNASAAVALRRPRYRPKDVEAMEELWDRRVKEDEKKLDTLAWRIEGLVVNPNRAIHELKLWKRVVVDSEDHIDNNFVSLP